MKRLLDWQLYRHVHQEKPARQDWPGPLDRTPHRGQHYDVRLTARWLPGAAQLLHRIRNRNVREIDLTVERLTEVDIV
jgi:hypothetical protein